jgi:surface antigen
MPPFDPASQIRLLFAALGLMVMSHSNAVLAQAIPAPLLGWPGLTQDDIDRMHAAAARLYEGRSIGTVERWRSPDSKDAGEVKLIRSFESHGMPCRTIDYTIRFESARNSPDRYIINWCQVSGDTWKIVEVPRPR